MSRRYSSGISIGKIVIFVLVLKIIILAIFGVLFYRTYSDNFTKSFQAFYVQHESSNVFYESHMTFKQNKDYSFDCKDTFKFFKSKDNQCSGYTVNVYASQTNTFNFTVDGYSRAYSTLGDISAAFTITKDKTSFTIKADKTMQQVLNVLHSSKQVVLPGDKSFDDYYYVLVIGNKSGSAFVYIDFKVEP